MAIGAPRLPQAMARKTKNVAGTRKSPSASDCPSSASTTANSGTPISGQTTICASLPRRGATRSGASVAITPTLATAAASRPRNA